jgi:hypothetical protein
MNQQSAPETRKKQRRVLALSLGVLFLSVGLCYVLYEYSPLGWIYFSLTSDHFLERVETLVPEYHELNDAVMQSLPIYPEATLLPQTQRWEGPSYNPAPPGGPGSPPYLWVCFSTNDTLEEVGEFYQKALEQDGWKLNQNTGAFNRGQACVMLTRCWAEVETESKLVYQIRVYHDINTLLDFPRIPKIMYWLEDVEHCP